MMLGALTSVSYSRRACLYGEFCKNDINSRNFENYVSELGCKITVTELGRILLEAVEPLVLRVRYMIFMINAKCRRFVNGAV